MEPAAPQVPNADAAAPSSGNPDLFIHDAGRVYAGETISHTFTVRNDFDEPMRVVKEEKNCGCTSIKPKSGIVAVGGETTVRVTLSSNGREGWLQKGGAIHWESPSGHRRRTTFQVGAEIVPVLGCNPRRIQFSEHEIGAVKEVAVRSPLPVDWNTLKATAPQPFFVRDLTVNDAGATCKVRCVPGEDISDAQGYLALEATVRADSLRLAGEKVRSSIDLSAHQDIELSVLPKNVPIRFDDSGTRGVGRILMRGRALANGTTIESIECPGCPAVPNLKRNS